MKARKLLQLLNDNRQRQREPQAQRILKNEATNEVTIYVYDAIVASQAEADWWGGVSAEWLVPELLAQPAGTTVHLRINSPGGDVFAAQAIVAAMRETRAQIVAHIDGLAASAASVLAVAADRAVAHEGSMLMIHNSWTLAMGNAADMRETADLLDKVDGTIAASYARKSGKSAEDFKPLMDAETWFTGTEALDMKLIDELHEPEAKPAASWNLAAYANAPKPPPAAPAAVQAPAPATALATPAAPVLDRAQADRLIALATGFKKAA